jgi:putative transposase
LSTNSAADEEEAVCEYREQLEREFLETFGDNLDEDVVDWALGSKLLDNDSDDGDESEPNDTDDEEEVLHMVFETNHPSLTVTDEDGDRYDEQTLLHIVARLTKLYSHRWDIENGYKKVKSFMVETTSTDLRYRFFFQL